ncbi:MAG: OB-fold nucleic acid binding domain-containing protein [Candidatus Caldatribacteriota bacterium]|jgi:DNA polymerase-3 subunit alpha|nr:OB-fold nucleic acid binding domain-containing protein [Atribacterota bacterium]MDD3030841.1 OB-fold nucleic acid binding domain-containing protein [Atribacterota bacterium]MDD3640232.1 OB-fold nucleic acid binding domain-containing protein [Atribacterota bacterium]MDD4288249.1 OB-fold nucleic acid binding domain-containing protein [Atribacterota bacterium]MDD4764362.1 OB-fold nucleic acid binding domain-containing protein [Atribacterota bacterium]
MSTLLKFETKNVENSLLLQETIPAYTFSPSAILKIEKDILGIYVSSHPLSVYRKRISDHLPSGNIYVRSNQIEQLRPGQHVCIAGLLIQVRRQFTKNHKIMAFLLLEDESGFFEAIAFPETFQQYFSLLVKDALLMIEGNTGNREKEEKIIINKIQSINSNSGSNAL